MRYSSAVDKYQFEILDKLLTMGKKDVLQKGEIFQDTDNKLYMSYIEEGYIKRYSIRNDGSLAVQSIYGPGYYFPLTLAWKIVMDVDIYQGPEIFHYEAMTKTVVRSIDNRTFTEAINSTPLMYKDLFFVAGRRTHSNIQRIENINIATSYKRVAHQLLYFASVFGAKQAGSKMIINLPLTHQDIADVISSTRETVSLAIAELKREKIVKSGAGKKIIVLDVEKLKDTAYS